MIIELTVFKFHCEGQPLRAYFDQVFQTAEFLQYEATEEQLVQRIIMNLHPNILNPVSLVDKPKSRKDLALMVSLIEEQSSVLAEREKLLRANPSLNSRRGRHDFVGNNSPSSRRPVTCWGCGRAGNIRSGCPRREVLLDNTSKMWSQGSTKLKILSSFHKNVAVPAVEALWVLIQLKSGKVPALVDTGAQLSCVRADVV